MTKTSSALDALTQLAAKVDAVLKASPASNLEANARQHFVSQLARQGLVTREEYEIQTALLEKSRQKLKALEARIAELEAEHRASPQK
ncbi:MAG: accessory factor UbiK family protein [Betaproteobacteria bacterium]